jgi:hypothetical protein
MRDLTLKGPGAVTNVRRMSDDDPPQRSKQGE